MNNKYLLLLGIMLFAALGEVMETAAISPASPVSSVVSGPYAKRKAIKPQHKHQKSSHWQSRPLARSTY